MKDRLGTFAAVLVIAFVAIFGVFYTVKGLYDCNQAHGMFVKKWNGFYACVEKGQH